MEQVILTAALTVIVGALTLVVGNVLDKGFLEPALELKREIGRIAHSLAFYANKRFGVDPEVQEVTRQVFRTHACRLLELSHTTTAYWFFRWVVDLPRKENVLEAASLLIGHSNFPAKQDGVMYDRSAEVKKCLRIAK